MKFLAVTLTTMVVAVQASINMGMIDVRNLLVPRAEVLNANLMTFSGTYGGSSAPAITQSSSSSRPFQVNGDLFDSFKNAWQRSCAIQQNLCSDFANSAAGRSQGIEVAKCQTQSDQCDSAVNSQTATAFATLATSDANFDYYCEP